MSQTLLLTFISNRITMCSKKVFIYYILSKKEVLILKLYRKITLILFVIFTIFLFVFIISFVDPTLITTISPALPFVFLDEDLTEVEKENSKIVLKGIIDCAKTCLENNIKVGLGTDTACPYITHYDMWRELVYFSHIIGVSKKYAIYTATLNNAEILGIDHLTGSIEIGKSADFIVVDDDPTIDLKTIRYPYMVGFRGRIFKKPRVKKNKNVEEKLDYIMEEVLTN